MTTLRVTMVCTGNICRSPIAEVVVRDAVEQAGLGDLVVIDSAGTSAGHVGGGADPRALAVLAENGYDGSAHRSSRITAASLADGSGPDLLLALDSGHHEALREMSPDAEVRMLRSFDPVLAHLPDGSAGLDVPDPYYDDLEAFREVLAMVEAATPALVAHLARMLDDAPA